MREEPESEVTAVDEPVPGLRRGALSRHAALAVAALGLLSGCERIFYPFPPLSPRVEALPQRISEMRFYTDDALTEISPDLRPYRPNYELWSDGATKRRWIRLPPNTKIDTSNMDDWSFPVGTELWKEFTSEGKRVETRLMLRESEAEDGWVAVSYAWDPKQADAIAVPDGVEDALGTSHDVPEARACMACHGGRKSRVLGFSAIQLSRPTLSSYELTLERLTRDGLITEGPAVPVTVPGDEVESAALGYMHSNCGNCHNANRPSDAKYLAPPVGLDLYLQVGALRDVTTTPSYRTSIPAYVKPGRPERSSLFRHVASPDWPWQEMPPFAVDVVDARAVDLLYDWIQAMSPAPVDPPAAK